MAADLYQLLRIDAKKHKYEKTLKISEGKEKMYKLYKEKLQSQNLSFSNEKDRKRKIIYLFIYLLTKKRKRMRLDPQISRKSNFLLDFEANFLLFVFLCFSQKNLDNANFDQYLE